MRVLVLCGTPAEETLNKITSQEVIIDFMIFFNFDWLLIMNNLVWKLTIKHNSKTSIIINLQF